MKTITATKNALISIFRILDATVLLNVTDKLSVLKVMRILKPLSVSFDEIVRDTQEKLRPEDWQEHIDAFNALRRSGNVSEEEKKKMDAYYAKFNNEVHIHVVNELEKEATVEIEPLSEETIAELASANKNLTGGQLLLMLELLTASTTVPEESASGIASVPEASPSGITPVPEESASGSISPKA